MATTKTRFDPDAVAFYEKAGWEAYYARAWGRAFRLLVRLNRAEFGMSWPSALAGALDVVRASRAFAPLMGNDVPAATHYLARFYARARHALGMAATPQRLADLEMRYWVVHRELAIRRQIDRQDNDMEPLVQTLAALHAALFAVDDETARASAEARALAAIAVDRITGGYSEDIAADWRAVEHHLQQAYRRLQAPSAR